MSYVYPLAGVTDAAAQFREKVKFLLNLDQFTDKLAAAWPRDMRTFPTHVLMDLWNVLSQIDDAIRKQTEQDISFLHILGEMYTGPSVLMGEILASEELKRIRDGLEHRAGVMFNDFRTLLAAWQKADPSVTLSADFRLNFFRYLIEIKSAMLALQYLRDIQDGFQNEWFMVALDLFYLPVRGLLASIELFKAAIKGIPAAADCVLNPVKCLTGVDWKTLLFIITGGVLVAMTVSDRQRT